MAKPRRLMAHSSRNTKIRDKGKKTTSRKSFTKAQRESSGTIADAKRKGREAEEKIRQIKENRRKNMKLVPEPPGVDKLLKKHGKRRGRK